MIANPNYLSWYQRVQLIISVLVSTLSDSYVSNVMGCNTSQALWESLEKMFASQAHACIMQVHFQLATLKKGTSSITDYFHKMKTLNDTLAACGQPLNDFEAVSFLLAGLGSEFDPLVTLVTTRVDPISRDDIYGLLLAHEMRLEQQMATTNLSNASAHIIARNSNNSGQRDRSFNAARRRGFPNGHGYCDSFSGRRGLSSGRRGCGQHFHSHASGSSRLICHINNKSRHNAISYYQRFDQSPQHESQSPLQAFYSSPGLPTDDSWYLDSGATHDLASDLHNLNQTLMHTRFMTRFLWEMAQICLLINYSMFHLFAKICYLSVSLLMITLFTFEFHSTFFVIKDCRTRSILHQGPLKNGLYQPLPSSTSSPSRDSLVGKRTSADHWYKLLGHPALRTVKHAISKFSLPVISNKPVVSYASCQQAKAHQLPFPASTYVFNHPLELLFFDV
jgi:hypothetical protein